MVDRRPSIQWLYIPVTPILRRNSPVERGVQTSPVGLSTRSTGPPVWKTLRSGKKKQATLKWWIFIGYSLSFRLYKIFSNDYDVTSVKSNVHITRDWRFIQGDTWPSIKLSTDIFMSLLPPFNVIHIMTLQRWSATGKQVNAYLLLKFALQFQVVLLPILVRLATISNSTPTSI